MTVQIQQNSVTTKLPPQEHIAQGYKVSIRTARRYLKRRVILKIGRKPKINYLPIFLNKYLVDNTKATQAEIAEYLFEKTGKHLSQQAIS